MRRILSSFILLIVLLNLSRAQSTIPYSRFGIGILQSAEPAWMKGWGNQSAAFRNPFNLNYLNPASYGSINYTVLEAGLFTSVLKVKTDADTSATFTDGGLATLSLGFPVIRNKLGVSMGITPYSRVDYNIIQENDTTSGVGSSANNFTGDGGLYKFHVGAGYKWKDLSVGVNAAYLFGTLDYTTVLGFPDTTNAFGTLRNESRSFGDIVFTGGLQYRLTLNEEKGLFLDLGVHGDLKTDVSASRTLLYSRFTYYSSSGVFQSTPQPVDTIYNESEDGIVVFPPQLSGGAMFVKANYFMVGIQYDFAAWSQYLSFGESDFTADSWRISGGVQVVPDYKAFTDYWKLIAYRAGFSVGKNYLEFDNKNLLQYQVSVGAGLPIRRVLSECSIAAEWVKIGSVKENPLAISNFRFTLGVTLNDRWFQKRKFD
jgi:hypothetical protein